MTSETVSNQMPNGALGSLSASEVRELIASRAYELYRQRGARLGDELSDWLNAEGEVVTMLLSEPQQTPVMEMPNGGRAAHPRNGPRRAKAANGTRTEATRRSKPKNTLTGSPA